MIVYTPGGALASERLSRSHTPCKGSGAKNTVWLAPQPVSGREIRENGLINAADF